MAFVTEGQAWQDLRDGKLRLLPAYTAGFQKMLKALMALNPAERPSAEKVLQSSLLVKKQQHRPQYAGLVLQPSVNK